MRLVVCCLLITIFHCGAAGRNVRSRNRNEELAPHGPLALLFLARRRRELPVESEPRAFLVRVSGDGLREHGIFPGDVLVVESNLDLLPWHELLVKETYGGLIIETLPAGACPQCSGVYYGAVTGVIRRHSHAEIRSRIML